jgi:hypothetical protein
MAYKLTATAWLERETERVKSVLLVHMDPDMEYSGQELLDLVCDHGLDYSNPEYQGIRDQLIADGVIEQV